MKTAHIIAALVLVMALLITGCDGGDTSHLPPDSHGSTIIDSEPSDSDASSDNPGQHSTSSVIISDDPPDSGDPSSEPVDNPDDPDISDPPESSVSGSSQSNHQPPESSPGSSSSSSPKPIEVVIPEVTIPTSPGTKTSVSTNGVIDYSNANSGYVSAKYTGTKSRSKIGISANSQDPYYFNVDTNGKTEYFPLSYGNGTYTVTLFELVEGISYATVTKVTFEVNMSNPRAPYTVPTQYVNYNQNSNLVKKAAELCAGADGNIDKIAAVFQWITANISYDYNLAATVKSGYVPNPDNTLATRKGICFDYASLMAAMLRSQGIPTRLVIGYAYSNPEDIYHSWNEVYTEQTGWITPELLLRNNGYNLVDATFYAGTNDKKGISDYISNTSNYSALYYY